MDLCPGVRSIYNVVFVKHCMLYNFCLLSCLNFFLSRLVEPVLFCVQVAARFLLAKHRTFVHEMLMDGLLNEKVLVCPQSPSCECCLLQCF